jgi:PAS domain S-box-containing protein
MLSTPSDLSRDLPAEEDLPFLPMESLARLVAELQSQNKILRYSQANAESASERFETLFSSVPLALMVIDEHDMVVQANSMAHRRFQPTEFDRPLISLMPFVCDAHVPKVIEAFAQAERRGHAETTEVVFQIGDDGTLTGDLHVRRVETHQDGEQPLVQYICAVIDQGPLLTERRALQQSASALQERNAQLHASESRLEAVINSALDAIICVDRDRRITVFNPTAAALFQCPAGQALGSPLERFLPNAAEALAFTQVSTQALLGELTARTAGGKELSVEVSVSIERHATGDTTTVFARDLTGRKRDEAHRAVLEAQLRESQKMQAVGTMAGGIAHDFNNILGAILGNVELARADLPPGSAALVSLEEIDKAGRRARALVRQILTFSRNEAPRRKALDLSEVVQETQRLLRVTLPPLIDLNLHLGTNIPMVLADETQVEQALLNLCTNAIHAIADGRGRVDIHLASLQPDLRKRERLGLKAGTYVRLSVQDSGQGMELATMERIFEPFFTTKPVGQGTGLGLAVVHGVMRTHDGAADVQSAPGMGSTFSLYFPALTVEQALLDAEPPAIDLPITPVSEKSINENAMRHVFYVDDDQALVFLVERLLRRRGYRVSTFTDPHEAARALRANPMACDLLVTDYNMPGYSGVDLLREVRQIRADLPVALASGYVTTEIERSAIAEGSRALIHKPNDVEELCATVHRLLA